MPGIWKLLKTAAENQQGQWAFRLDPTDLSAYATFRTDKHQWNSVLVNPLPNHAAVPEEIYVRGSDLIMRFAQSSGDAYSFQLNWKSLKSSNPVVAGMELWISVQTNLLDSSPMLEICSEGKAGAWQIYNHGDLSDSTTNSPDDSPAALVLTNANASFVWLIEPSDQRHSELLTANADAVQRVQLFNHFMEKGVIRRARMRFLASCPTLSIEQIQAAYREFAESPLPLTA